MTNELTERQKKRRKKAIRRRRILLLVLILIAGISICLFTPIFNIKTVQVEGNEQVSTEKILETAAIPDGINMFKVNKRGIERALLKIPEIESVHIRYGLPPKIRLEITETRAALLFPYMRGYAVTNTSGKTMAHFEVSDGLGLVTVTGVKLNTAEICKPISVQDEAKFEVIMEVITALEKEGLLTELRSANFENLADIHFYTKDGVKIILGKTEELNYKFSMLKAVLPQVNRIENSYIDLTTPSRTVYGTFDEDPPAPIEDETTTEGENTEETTNETGETEEKESEDEASAA